MLGFVIAQSLLSPSLGLAFWITVVFLATLAILRIFAWGPITSAMQEREETIDASIKRAEKALAEAKQIQADNEKARREAEREAQRIMREARDEAEQIRSDEAAKTREKIQQMQQQAQAEIEREKQGALDELRAEVADLAIQAAGKILSEDLNEQRHRRLVGDFIDDLPRN